MWAVAQCHWQSLAWLRCKLAACGVPAHFARHGAARRAGCGAAAAAGKAGTAPPRMRGGAGADCGGAARLRAAPTGRLCFWFLCGSETGAGSRKGWKQRRFAVEIRVKRVD